MKPSEHIEEFLDQEDKKITEAHKLSDAQILRFIEWYNAPMRRLKEAVDFHTKDTPKWNTSDQS